MGLAIKAVGEEVAHAVGAVSAGNTGALMAPGLLRAEAPCPGIDRPAIASFMPNGSAARSVMLDLGANVHCDATNAGRTSRSWANVFARTVLGIQRADASAC